MFIFMPILMLVMVMVVRIGIRATVVGGHNFGIW